MAYRAFTRLSLALALAAGVAAAPAEAQGKGNGNGNGKKQSEVRKQKDQKRPTLERRERDDDRYDVRADRDRRDSEPWYGDSRDAEAKAGPPFCRNGQGHPVHGRRWCEEKGYGVGGYGTYGTYSRNDRDVYGDRSGSYEAQHEDFHRYLDRKYSDQAAQRPLDIRWQLEVRSRKKAEHDRWHQQTGRRHD